MPMLQLVNVHAFLAAARAIGVRVFTTVFVFVVCCSYVVVVVVLTLTHRQSQVRGHTKVLEL